LKCNKTSGIGRLICSRLAKRLESTDGRFDTAYQLLLSIKAGTSYDLTDD